MSSYLMTKYKGVYNLRAEIDLRTNDYCRTDKGELENYSDIWIECEGKGRIYHYGKSILQYYQPSLQRGHNIIKKMYVELCNGDIDKISEQVNIINVNIKEQNKLKKDDEEFTKLKIKTIYDFIYPELLNLDLISNIEETDEEILFKFKTSNLDKLSDFLKPKSTCFWNPFSSKYLKQNVRKTGNKYIVSQEDLQAYKDITSLIPKGDMRIYVEVNKLFMKKISTKDHTLETIRNEIKVKGMKAYEYFNYLGEDTWNKYLKFLKAEVNKKYNV